MDIEELKNKDVLAEMLRNLKLGKSLYTTKYDVDNYTLETARFPMDEAIQNEMVKILANNLIKDKAVEITKSTNGWATTYELQMMITNLDEFKEIVEIVIQKLTPEQINKIRNG